MAAINRILLNDYRLYDISTLTYSYTVIVSLLGEDRKLGREMAEPFASGWQTMSHSTLWNVGELMAHVSSSNIRFDSKAPNLSRQQLTRSNSDLSHDSHTSVSQCSSSDDISPTSMNCHIDAINIANLHPYQWNEYVQLYMSQMYYQARTRTALRSGIDPSDLEIANQSDYETIHDSIDPFKSIQRGNITEKKSQGDKIQLSFGFLEQPIEYYGKGRSNAGIINEASNICSHDGKLSATEQIVKTETNSNSTNIETAFLYSKLKLEMPMDIIQSTDHDYWTRNGLFFNP